MRLGEHNLLTDPDCELNDDDEEECVGPAQNVAVESFVFHPQYSRTAVHHDIGLIRLAEEANLAYGNFWHFTRGCDQ